MVYYLNGIGMYEDLTVGQDEGIEWICSQGGKVFDGKNLCIKNNISRGLGAFST